MRGMCLLLSSSKVPAGEEWVTMGLAGGSPCRRSRFLQLEYAEGDGRKTARHRKNLTWLKGMPPRGLALALDGNILLN